MRLPVLAATGVLFTVLGAVAAAAAPAPAPVYRIVDRIAGPDGGWDYLHVDTARNRLLVAHGTAVMAVDLATRAVTSGLAPGQRLHDALPVGGELLVTYGGTATAVFADAATGTALATIATGKGPDAAAVDPRSGLVLVMNHAGGDITLIDPRTHQAVGTVTVGGDLEAAAIVDGIAYVNVEDTAEIAVVDIAQRRLVTRWKLPGCEAPTGIVAVAGGRRLIAACDGSSVIVDRGTGQVVQTLATGAGADGIAYDPARNRAFVSAGRDGTLAVIDLAGRSARVVQTLPTQQGARTIAIDPRDGRLYLPAARYAPAVAGSRPAMLPGSFVVLVVAPAG
ncbi:MAG: YncE family protein [Sphingomonadales bacterium]|jgi:DNA-binding beta-propeller fold protein YncE